MYSRKTVKSRIRTVSEELGISPPSAVQMLKKLEKRGLVDYVRREGVRLTIKGRMAATKIIRNHRLIESLPMQSALFSSILEHVHMEILFQWGSAAR
jgi:Mn-dependent DtxR family transcriptional regulator